MKRLYIVRISVVFRYSILYKWFHLHKHSILKILFSKGEKKRKKNTNAKTNTRFFFIFNSLHLIRYLGEKTTPVLWEIESIDF